MPRPNVTISKTRFQSGLHCARRLWLDSYHRELAAPMDRASRVRLAAGHRIGKLAQELWPGGQLVEIAAARHARAVTRTLELLEDPEVPAVFEAAFEGDGVRVRADAVVRVDDGFELYEVKSSSRLKAEHLTDVAVQIHAMESQGVAVARAFLVHLDTGYRWDGGAIDPHRLFVAEEVTESMGEARARVVSELPRLRAALARTSEPDVPIGRHCRRPYPCPFMKHCWKDAPKHPVSELPRAREELLAAFARDGIDDLRRVDPNSYDLNPVQRTAVQAAVSGLPIVRARALRRALARLRYPVTFLDFETFNPALPIYPGTRPHQVIPFQWSAHVLEEDGSLGHRDFLWTGTGDPRAAFVGSLAEALPDQGSIVVYSDYERQRLADLARLLPEDASPVLAQFQQRSFDLLEVVRDSVYHPDFHGSFSLKRVLPALVPGSGYEGLVIAGGQDAGAAYAQLIDPRSDPETRAGLEDALRAYCEADTRAEHELLRALHALAYPDRDGPS